MLDEAVIITERCELVLVWFVRLRGQCFDETAAFFGVKPYDVHAFYDAQGFFLRGSKHEVGYGATFHVGPALNEVALFVSRALLHPIALRRLGGFSLGGLFGHDHNVLQFGSQIKMIIDSQLIMVRAKSAGNRKRPRPHSRVTSRHKDHLRN